MSSDQFLTFIASKWNDMVDKAGVSASLKNCLSFMVWHIKRMPLDAAVVEFQRGRDSDAHTATSPGGEVELWFHDSRPKAEESYLDELMAKDDFVVPCVDLIKKAMGGNKDAPAQLWEKIEPALTGCNSLSYPMMLLKIEHPMHNSVPFGLPQLRLVVGGGVLLEEREANQVHLPVQAPDVVPNGVRLSVLMARLHNRAGVGKPDSQKWRELMDNLARRLPWQWFRSGAYHPRWGADLVL